MIVTISQFSNLKFLNTPEFIWSGIFNLLTTLICGLISELDELIINSIYKLDLSRPKYSMQRNNMYNVDVEKITKKLEEESIVCLC